MMAMITTTMADGPAASMAEEDEIAKQETIEAWHGHSHGHHQCPVETVPLDGGRRARLSCWLQQWQERWPPSI